MAEAVLLLLMCLVPLVGIGLDVRRTRARWKRKGFVKEKKEEAA